MSVTNQYINNQYRQMAYLLAGVMTLMALLASELEASRAAARIADLERQNSSLATSVSQLQKELQEAKKGQE